MEPIPRLLQAMRFAAHKHRDQKRKDGDATPYINHPIEVAELLAQVGGVRDPDVLCAALLHDTIEDTETTGEDLEAVFGPRVRALVEEVSDDKSLPKEERKRLQIEHAPHLSDDAKRIKVADKTSNVRDVTLSPPAGWSEERRADYLDWARRVIDGVRGVCPPLEAEFDRALAEGRARLGS